MQASPEDRTPQEPAKQKKYPLSYLLITGGLLLAFVLYLVFGEKTAPLPTPAPVPMAEVKPTPEPQPAPAPDIPQRPQAVAPEPAISAPEPEPMPTLDQSDAAVRAALLTASEVAAVDSLLDSSDLVQRGAGIVEGLNRGSVLYKVLPVPRPEGAFTVEEQAGQTVIAPASYQRYDRYADAIATLDSDAVIDTFHRFRPLFEQAYAGLGYSGDDFDNALVGALDRILATPEVTGPIALKQESVMYTFADPELEALPELQKQLLRMGPDNSAKIKLQARALRAGLLAP
jgi:hypothetical protein